MNETIATIRIQPDIYLFGLRITEPSIAMTSFLLAVLCFYAWKRLQNKLPDDPAARFMQAFFLLMGVATLIGGIIGHAFLHHFSMRWKTPGWLAGMLAVAALERASIHLAKPYLRPAWYRFFLIANIAEWALFSIVTIVALNFHIVEAHAALGLLLVVAFLQSFIWRKSADPGSRLVLGAIPIAVLSVLPHLSRFSFCRWFTYFDIGHVFMGGFIWLIMLGAERMRYEPDVTNART